MSSMSCATDGRKRCKHHTDLGTSLVIVATKRFNLTIWFPIRATSCVAPFSGHCTHTANQDVSMQAHFDMVAVCSASSQEGGDSQIPKTLGWASKSSLMFGWGDGWGDKSSGSEKSVGVPRQENPVSMLLFSASWPQCHINNNKMLKKIHTTSGINKIIPQVARTILVAGRSDRTPCHDR
jgi:hypothetical protein